MLLTTDSLSLGPQGLSTRPQACSLLGACRPSLQQKTERGEERRGGRGGGGGELHHLSLWENCPPLSRVKRL